MSIWPRRPLVIMWLTMISVSRRMSIRSRGSECIRSRPRRASGRSCASNQPMYRRRWRHRSRWCRGTAGACGRRCAGNSQGRDTGVFAGRILVAIVERSCWSGGGCASRHCHFVCQRVARMVWARSRRLRRLLQSPQRRARESGAPNIVVTSEPAATNTPREPVADNTSTQLPPLGRPPQPATPSMSPPPPVEPVPKPAGTNPNPPSALTNNNTPAAAPVPPVAGSAGPPATAPANGLAVANSGEKKSVCRE